MKPILKIKIAVDAAMSVSMLLLMAYGLVGEAAHEWIGINNRFWKFYIRFLI